MTTEPSYLLDFGRHSNLKLEKAWNIILKAFRDTLLQHFGTWWIEGLPFCSFFFFSFLINYMNRDKQNLFSEGQRIVPFRAEFTTQHTFLYERGFHWITFSQYCRPQYKSWVTIKASHSSITTAKILYVTQQHSAAPVCGKGTARAETPHIWLRRRNTLHNI